MTASRRYHMPMVTFPEREASYPACLTTTTTRSLPTLFRSLRYAEPAQQNRNASHFVCAESGICPDVVKGRIRMHNFHEVRTIFFLVQCVYSWLPRDLLPHDNFSESKSYSSSSSARDRCATQVISSRRKRAPHKTRREVSPLWTFRRNGMSTVSKSWCVASGGIKEILVSDAQIQTMTRGYTDEADRLLNYLVSTLFYAPHTAVSPPCRNMEYSTPFRSSICVLLYSLFTL